MHNATHCNAPQHTRTHCNTLQPFGFSSFGLSSVSRPQHMQATATWWSKTVRFARHADERNMGCVYYQKVLFTKAIRLTQSILYVPLQVNRFQKIILVIVQYKYFWNHIPEIFILQNLILRTRSCVTGFITQSSWFFHFHLTTLVSLKWFVCTTVVPVSKGHLGGASP